MIHIRPFLNCDPPSIVEIWNAQPAVKRLTRGLKLATYEHFVLAKPYFDRCGVFVALNESRPIGFIHAGFGPNTTHTDIDETTGILCTLQCLPEYDSPELRSQLVSSAEAYLISRGATEVFSGAVSPNTSFFHGLSSTGEWAGIPDEDTDTRQTMLASGFVAERRNIIFHRDLTAFRPPFDRTQRALQKQYEIMLDLETDLADWWELCRYGPLPRCRFRAINRTTHAPAANVAWWDQAFTGAALQPTVCFTQLEVTDQLRRNGVGTLLMNEAMKQLKASGAFYASVQIDESNEPAAAFFQSLGFQDVGRGTTYRKPLQTSTS